MEGQFLANLTSPPLLFFILGAAAALFRSDLEIPEQIAKFLSIYLLFAIGFKGGVALSESTIDLGVLATLGVALVLASVIPFGVFFLLKRKMRLADAAATAATYGSISAVTFVTCTSYLDGQGISWSGYLVAAMALMESPAIIVGLFLYRVYRTNGNGETFYARDLLRESFLNGSVFLIIGSLIVGWITGTNGMTQVGPFVGDLFIGVLCLFLLDMGIVAMRRIHDISDSTGGVTKFGMTGLGLLLPLAGAILATLSAGLLGLTEGDALLLVVLAASASYIAVPAAMRLALPEANPSVYLGMSLAITFPFNLLLGIPLYHTVLRLLYF